MKKLLANVQLNYLIKKENTSYIRLINKLIIMKKIRIILSLIAFMFFMNVAVNAQMIYDIKVKNPTNEKDRTMMLDILRANLYQNYKQELIFEVKQ